MSVRVVMAAAFSVLLISTNARAVSLTNRDDTDRKVTVVEGEARQDHVIKPGGTLDGICRKGCLVQLDDGADEPYELEGPEVTWIEGGVLLEEQLDDTSEPPSGDADQRSQPSPKP